MLGFVRLGWVKLGSARSGWGWLGEINLDRKLTNGYNSEL